MSANINENIINKVHSHLEEAMVGRHPNINKVDDGEHPILLLTTEHDVAGFAVITDDAKNSYNHAYNNFKKIYTDNREKWSRRNLTFVLCRTDTDNKYDSFYKKIENDVYFCKKFVIDIGEDSDSIVEETARLPFIPLESGRTIGVSRPLPARSYLINLGLDRTHAGELSKQVAHRAERILNDTINGIYDVSRIKLSDDQSNEIQPDKFESIARLNSVVCQDFRAYKGRHEFDLDSDVVILYGPNGLGKTSFFDAIEFLCTGKVAHLNSITNSTPEFIKILPHLSNESNAAEVSGEFNIESKISNCTRKSSAWDEVIYTEKGEEITKRIDRKSFLSLLTGISKQLQESRVEYLERIFRATHYFGQGYQELLSSFKQNSSLSEEIVARMLAVEDYVRASNRTQEIFNNAIKEIKSLTDEKNEIENLKNLTATELKNLQDIKTNGVGKEGSLSGLIEKIESEIRKQFYIVDAKPLNLNAVEVTQQWASTISAEKNGLHENISALDTLSDQLRILEEDEVEAQNYEHELNELKLKFNSIKQNKENIDDNINKSKLDIAKLESDIEIIIKSLETQEWLLITIPEFNDINQQFSKLSTQIETVRKSKNDILEEINKLKEIKSEQKNTKLELEKEVNLIDQKLNELVDLLKGIGRWIYLEEETNKLNLNLTNKQQSKIFLKNKQPGLEDILKNAKIESARIKASIQSVKNENEKVNRILEQVESIIDGPDCPVCGTKHESANALIEKIHLGKTELPKFIAELHDQLNSAVIVEENINSEINNSNKEIENIDIEINSIQAKISSHKDEIELFLNKARKLSLPVSTDNLDQSANHLKNKLANTLDASRQKLEQAKKGLDTTNFNEKELIDKESNASNELENLTFQQSSLRNKLDTIINEAQERNAILDTNFKTEEEKKNIISKEINDLNDDKLRKIQGVQSLEKELLDINSELIAFENKIKSLEEKLEKIKIKRNELSRQGKILKLLDDEISSKRIIDKIKELEEKIKEFQELDTDINKLIYILEESEHNKRLSELSNELEKQNQNINQLANKIKNYQNISSFYQKIKSLLDSKREDVVSNYVEKLGPISSIIVERLRKIYGFGDIKLDAQEGGINVRVDYRGKKVLPSFYFSDSQKQIVMLSLFLSASLTQTWSRFRPILMDDPVTHFDDLNVYSYADLLRTLVEDNNMECQFIISTCEERMYRLLRQKLSGLNNRNVISYNFSSIGNEGPVYEKQ